MKRILAWIGLILFMLGGGCTGGRVHKNANDGYEEQKQEGAGYHHQNIQRLITRDPAQDPRK